MLGKEFSDEYSKKAYDKILERLKKAKVRLSKTVLPLRGTIGTIIDPSYEYDRKSYFCSRRPQNAFITEKCSDPSLIAGIKKYFDPIWKI